MEVHRIIVPSFAGAFDVHIFDIVAHRNGKVFIMKFTIDDLYIQDIKVYRRPFAFYSVLWLEPDDNVIEIEFLMILYTPAPWLCERDILYFISFLKHFQHGIFDAQAFS